ncbi:DUF2268 domain-containing putative Zn-dependent protease [Actinomadura logoneensis]|uniref:DUF2268 domain-containing putative Zn-dependent protease n=1 Tax=Actinomadura logoneensis TaxID=2293572 RepID=UPI001F1D244A|nr:DUF2268 domain-containing putative Zn-dependent protease [Actinomadura logoneensis]
MQNFTAWAHGDPSAERFGLTPVGLPMGAGYAAGNRLVDTYLAATGQTAAQALHAGSSEITCDGLRAHIAALEQERDRIERQIRSVRHTLEALRAGWNRGWTSCWRGSTTATRTR